MGLGKIVGPDGWIPNSQLPSERSTYRNITEGGFLVFESSKICCKSHFSPREPAALEFAIEMK
jgi:hypothetical protein